MFCQSFLLPQVKRGVIIINTHDTYELPPELPNNLRLNKYHENVKNFIEFKHTARSYSQNKNFVNTSKRLNYPIGDCGPQDQENRVYP